MQTLKLTKIVICDILYVTVVQNQIKCLILIWLDSFPNIAFLFVSTNQEMTQSNLWPGKELFQNIFLKVHWLRAPGFIIGPDFVRMNRWKRLLLYFLYWSVTTKIIFSWFKWPLKRFLKWFQNDFFTGFGTVSETISV